MNINNNKEDVSNDRALFIIKPRAIKIRMEFILLNKLLENGFLVLKYLKRKLSKEFWEEFYKNISHKDFFDSYCTYLASDFVGLALIYNKNDVFSKIRNLIGPTNPKDCKPFHLRYQFGIDLDDNGMHASDSIDSFKYEIEVLKNFKIVF
ncbi:nucleoside diphosphate kinase [uncultured bacterium]|nr:nucleoside diphosphate kinase [uncultured bacterium]